MPQAKLIRAEKTDKGIKLTFLDFNNKEVSGIYTNGELTEQDFLRMIGHKLSFSHPNKTEELNVHKAWNENGTPTYCDSELHGIDR